MAHTRRLTVALAVPVLAVALAACGSSSSSSGSTQAGSSTSASGGGVTLGGTDGLVAVTVTNPTDLKAEPVLKVTPGKTPSGLLTKDLVVGTGTAAVATDTVNVQYLGANAADGKTFDASWEHGGATSFPLANVVPGFKQGIVGMKPGGRRVMILPPALGYGDQAQGPIVANETLIFVVDLVSAQ